MFRVSPAGLSLGGLLVRHLSHEDTRGRFLELGTGSGVLALLLRSMGACRVTATDVSPAAVRLARHNERLNFGDGQVSFATGNLFSALRSDETYDHVIFNPPGWRSPSAYVAERLAETSDGYTLDLSAMFSGDSVVLDFLKGLPQRLARGGRAIIGLNSMMGIQDVLTRYQECYEGEPPLRLRLLERHSFPLLLYTEKWAPLRSILVEEFHRWREDHNAAFSQDDDGTIYWSYEIVECAMADQPCAGGA